jgi:K+-transporting ATPase ATPase C chain
MSPDEQSLSGLWRPAILLFLVMTVLTGLVYPLVLTGIAGLAFPSQAVGSLVERNGTISGSILIGQEMTSPGYFHGRPSAVSYAANGSGASNLGPTNPTLIDLAEERVGLVREENGMDPTDPVPADLVLSSGSGLDPHISVEAAMLQVPRIAAARGLPAEEVRSLVLRYREPASLGVWSHERVNVLGLNMALDTLAGRHG